jgi:hypothetical protein
VVTAVPAFTPSSWNCTLATPIPLVALATTTVVPDSVTPFAGDVIVTTGGATALFTVTVSLALVVLFPAVSVATAFNVWVPFELFLVSHV